MSSALPDCPAVPSIALHAVTAWQTKPFQVDPSDHSPIVSPASRLPGMRSCLEMAVRR